MASPHVAGVAALAWGSHRYADNITIRRLLAWRADPMGRMGRTDEYGFGRIDAEAATVELEQPPPIEGIPVRRRTADGVDAQLDCAAPSPRR